MLSPCVDHGKQRSLPKEGYALVGIRAPNGVSRLAQDYGVDTNVIYKVLRGAYPK